MYPPSDVLRMTVPAIPQGLVFATHKHKYKKDVSMRRMGECLIFDSIPPRYRKQDGGLSVILLLMLTAARSHLS